MLLCSHVARAPYSQAHCTCARTPYAQVNAPEGTTANQLPGYPPRAYEPAFEHGTASGGLAPLHEKSGEATGVTSTKETAGNPMPTIQLGTLYTLRCVRDRRSLVFGCSCSRRRTALLRLRQATEDRCEVHVLLLLVWLGLPRQRPVRRHLARLAVLRLGLRWPTAALRRTAPAVRSAVGGTALGALGAARALTPPASSMRYAEVRGPLCALGATLLLTAAASPVRLAVMHAASNSGPGAARLLAALSPAMRLAVRRAAAYSCLGAAFVPAAPAPAV
jgi:hypothetical protein